MGGLDDDGDAPRPQRGIDRAVDGAEATAKSITDAGGTASAVAEVQCGEFATCAEPGSNKVMPTKVRPRRSFTRSLRVCGSVRG